MDVIIFSVFQKNRVLGYSWSTLLWHRCYYPHRSRDSVSPVCGIFRCGLIDNNVCCGSIKTAFLHSIRIAETFFVRIMLSFLRFFEVYKAFFGNCPKRNRFFLGWIGRSVCLWCNLVLQNCNFPNFSYSTESFLASSGYTI